MWDGILRTRRGRHSSTCSPAGSPAHPPPPQGETGEPRPETSPRMGISAPAGAGATIHTSPPSISGHLRTGGDGERQRSSCSVTILARSASSAPAGTGCVNSSLRGPAARRMRPVTAKPRRHCHGMPTPLEDCRARAGGVDRQVSSGQLPHLGGHRIRRPSAPPPRSARQRSGTAPSPGNRPGPAARWPPRARNSPLAPEIARSGRCSIMSSS